MFDCFFFVFFFSVFTEVMFFVLLRQEATFLPFGRTQAPRRITPGTVTLLNKDPIQAHLYRHMVITIRDGTVTTGTRVNVTTQGVIKATCPPHGRVRCLPIGDRARINPSTPRIITRTRHVTHANNRTIGSVIG